MSCQNLTPSSIKSRMEYYYFVNLNNKFLTVVINSNNAGIMTRNCTRSIDGLELQFATNHIGTRNYTAFLHASQSY